MIQSRIARKKSKRKTWRKVIMISSIVFAVLLASGVAYGYSVWHSVQKTANKIYEPVDDGQNLDAVNTDDEPKPISILLLGVDQRPGDKGRSDTVIVLTLNPVTKTMQMVSIPRDTRVTLIGKGSNANNRRAGQVDKMNAGYAYGGTKMAIDTVENFLNIDIDHYVRINMQGLSDLVDAVGGITVTNDISWYDEGYYQKGFYYHKGTLHLNGPQALGFVRMRHLDPRGDFGRNERQRDVIMAVVNKAKDLSSVTKYGDILGAIGDNVKTDFTFDEMKYVAIHYRDAMNNVKSYETEGTTRTINGVSYVLISEEERDKVHRMISEQMQLDGNATPSGGTEQIGQASSE